MKRKKLIYIFLLYVFISICILFLSINYINNEEKSLLDQKYSLVSKHTTNNITTLIKDKQNATLAFAMCAARDEAVIKALKTRNSSSLNLKNFSLSLREITEFKNIWFQIINKDGKSFYRSWTDKRDDSVLFRSDVQNILKNRNIQSSISVGRFDMTFKSMIPIFDKNHFIGVFEIISHFNSISKYLEKDGIDNLILAHKKYKKNIKYPFSKMFLEDYYIANLNAKKELIEQIKSIGIEKIINSKKNIIDNKRLISSHNIIYDNDIVGFIITSKKLSDIDITNIVSFKKAAIIYVSFTIILIGFIIGIINYSIYSNKIGKLNKKLKRNIKITRVQKKKSQTILDSQTSIIVITDGEIIKNSNKALFDFFNQYKNLKEFKKVHKCVCETFIDMHDENYVIDKDYDGKNWAEYILENSHKNFKAAIEKNNNIHHFTLSVNLSQFEDEETPFIIVTLTDISYEIKQNKQLKHLNENLEQIVNEKTKELKNLNESLEDKIKAEIKKSKEKDTILFQQNKMAAIGEMLSNLAHQWRQPLSCITTAASSIQLNRELNTLKKEDIEESCKYIIKSSKYLSQTIEDIKNYFKQEKEKQNFFIIDCIENNLKLLKEDLNMNNIEVIVDIDKEYSVFSYKNEFQQAILNILNNSIDAFRTNIIEEKKVIIINLNENQLTIKDNANGVDEKIIDKIFEPYFTTKHQSQGTGLSLYMTREILVNHLNCTINAFNISYIFENKEYKGLEFSIVFNN